MAGVPEAEPDGARRIRRRPSLGLAAGLVLVILLVAFAFIRRDDIRLAAMDPGKPFQIYTPPPAPDYDRPEAWALLPDAPLPPGEAAVFFLAPTTYSGAEHWNGPIDDPDSEEVFRRVMAPNHAGPFAAAGAVFAPRYRQAGLYSLTTLREDAREARRFAYADAEAAFLNFLARTGDRPILVVGVEQGGDLVARLLAEPGAAAAVRSRLVGAWVIDAVVPSDAPPLTPCQSQKEAGCLAAWVWAYSGDDLRARDLQDRSLVWSGGDLVNLGARRPLCYNPLLQAVTETQAPARLARGATNATGLEWGARPPFVTRQVEARCRNGILRVSRPEARMLRPSGSWEDRLRTPGFNLFYADIEADARSRLAAFKALRRPSSPSPDASRTGTEAP
ncbi:DUF3089 domain-containing protein [Phenylobacterium parvum]|uniref:DUF3089 domain-containing protein n=1 Tax=Phenylobacterium parvum TaxID=2201350 RepID=A0A2Z3HX85_9CAUL|nr:DUF3089 domain-containing protein [Phenylobacterium parvum]AWM77439.1 DUF3089 domain-containing protein [Phenylobacterium parvum]